jgi:hypothetical protein
MKRILERMKRAPHGEKALKAKVFSSWKDIGIRHDELERELNTFLQTNVARETGAPSPPVVKNVTQSESRVGSGPVSLTVIVWYE